MNEMTDTEITQADREMLAAELDRTAAVVDALRVRNGSYESLMLQALRAIARTRLAHGRDVPGDAVEAALDAQWMRLHGTRGKVPYLPEQIEAMALAIHAADRVRGRAVVNEIAAERRRQIEAEGWGANHDDLEHTEGELAKAAACYAHHAGSNDDDRQVNSGFSPPHWPWIGFWKPSSRRRDLIKAGALIVAEIERLDRAELPPPPPWAETPEPTIDFSRSGIQDGCENRAQCKADGECHYTKANLAGPGRNQSNLEPLSPDRTAAAIRTILTVLGWMASDPVHWRMVADAQRDFEGVGNG